MLKPLKIDPNFAPCPAVDGDELFPNGIFEFNITKMWEYIRNNADRVLLTGTAVENYPKEFSRLDEAHVDNTDIIKPVILAEIAPGRYNLVDGHHRMEKARRLGLTSLPAYWLDVNEHIPFLTSTGAYHAYVEYWNEKIHAIYTRPGKNILADLAAADDLRRKWPKIDLLHSLGFPIAVRQNICFSYLSEENYITLTDVFEIVISSKKDPRPGYLISKMLDCQCVGRVAFLKAVNHISQLDLGTQGNLAWKKRYKKFKEAHRAKGSRQQSWSFALTEAGAKMAKFSSNGAAYAPRRRRE
jgi:hypothetical protein